MIYITGDCHADFQNHFSEEYFPERKDLTKDDYVIVCGDFGIWIDDAGDRLRLDTLAKEPYTILFVDGNHENFDRLYSDEFKVIDFHGGKAHKIRKNIYHLMRGYVFTIEGKKFFAFGGASSHDIQDGILDISGLTREEANSRIEEMYNSGRRMFRINHLSWWEQELPSQEEMDFGLKTLAENDFKVDYIVTHCCAQNAASMYGFYKADKLTRYFDQIAETTSFDKWYCGHYHLDSHLMKYVFLYRYFEPVE